MPIPCQALWLRMWALPHLLETLPEISKDKMRWDLGFAPKHGCGGEVGEGTDEMSLVVS